jgi:glycosyltransferase involved in cell wall biosynthesis
MPDLLLMFRKLNKPIITTVHSTIKTQRLATQFSKKSFSNMERSEQATYLAYPALRLSEEIYYRKKRLFVSPSNWMKQWLINSFHINSDNISVIPNSVDLNDYESENSTILEKMFPENILKDKKIILFVGRLLALKGIEVLIEAIPNIIKKYGSNDLLFVFVGPGDRVRYLKMVRLLGVESSCFFTGPVSREVVINLMRNALLLVAPSFVENAPYSILESMACGLPVITTNVGGISEIIKHDYNGVLLEMNLSKEIEKSITALLGDETLRNSIKDNAIETIKNNFSWSVNLPKYLDVYSKALK